VSRRAALFFPYAVFLLLVAVSWNRWIEPFVDTGRELMVPWRLAHGEALYRDVPFYHGPLAPYLAAGIDLWCGRSLPARIAFAAVIALAHLEALRRLAGRFLTPPRAAVTAGTIVAVAFFLRPGGQLFPFSFDTSVAVASITWALYLVTGPFAVRRDAAAGACLAAALLCRPEMGIAAVLAVAWEARPARRLVVLAAAPALVAGAVYAFLSYGTPLETLRREGWLAIAGPPEAFRNVYAAYAGFDRPAFRLTELALAVVLLILIATLLVAAAFLSRSVRVRSRAAARSVEVAALLLLALAAAIGLHPPEALARSIALLPPLVRVVPAAVAVGAIARGLGRVTGRRGEPFAPIPDSVLLLAALFGLRLFLAAGYAGPYNAFLLPLPLLVTAAFLFSAADRFRAAAGESLSGLTLGALLLFLIYRVAALGVQYRQVGWTQVETPAGSLFLPEPIAATTRLALGDLSRRTREGSVIAGFPEVGFLEYVLGLQSALPEEQFFPGHLDAELEERTIRTLAANPPAAIVLCNVLAVGHGFRAFGQDYLVRLDRFLHDRFSTAASFGPGSQPGAKIGDPQFFIEIRVPRAEARR